MSIPNKVFGAPRKQFFCSYLYYKREENYNMTEMGIPWPNMNDNAFKEVPFSPTDACIDWIVSSGYDWAITESFKNVADKIVDSLETSEINEHADLYFFPVTYLYRHSIELSLKN